MNVAGPANLSPEVKGSFAVTLTDLRRILRDQTPLGRILRQIRGSSALRAWERAGRPVPPPQRYKADTVREYASRFGTKTLVETETYLGETIAAVKGSFTRLYSIEIDEGLFFEATKRFAGAPQVTILQGDSSRVCPMCCRALIHRHLLA